MHLGINEENGWYNCLRNPQHHGRSPYWLLKALGVASNELDYLVTTFGGVSRGSDTPQPARFKQSTLAGEWQRFRPASSDPDTMAYLARRGFATPERTADTFDLRVGTNTRARRLWFKLTNLQGQVTGFTGRAIDAWRQPRYYTEATETGLYMPRQPTGSHRQAILVEGPMDALRVAEATQRRRNLFVAALCGMAITSNKRMQLVEIAKTTPNFAVALDSTVWATDAQRIITELRTIPALGKITRLAMPANVDDPGDMTNLQVERWLTAI